MIIIELLGLCILIPIIGNSLGALWNNVFR